MAGIKRLTYYFYAYRKNEDNKIILKTNFPFIADQQLFINRPVERTDIVSISGQFDANPTLEELPNIVDISNYGYYTEQNWFIGLSVNGIVIYDGLFKKPEGIEAYIVNLGDGPEGTAVIDLEEFGQEFGILDNLEIVIISAQTWTPWLYYGYLGQARAFLSKNIDNGSWRKPTNMGGIPTSLVPAQAIQMRHFVNVNLSEIFVPVIVPFISAFFIGTTGSASSSNNVFNTTDVIDGNGQLKVRSSVKFNISSQSLTQTVAGFSAAIRTVIRADAYRTINSRKLEYIDTTYIEKKLIKNTVNYVAFEKNLKYKEIYKSIANSLSLIVKNFVDISEEDYSSFIFLAYDNETVDTLSFETSNLEEAAGTLLQYFNNDSFYTITPSEEEELEEGDRGWNNVNMKIVLGSIRVRANIGNSNKSTQSIIFSGMNLSTDSLEETIEAKNELSFVTGTFGVFLQHSSSQLTSDIFKERKSVGESIFGSSYLGIQEGAFPGFQLVNIFYKALGGSLTSETSLYEESKFEFNIPNDNPDEDPETVILSGVDTDILRFQCQNTVKEIYDASLVDYDGDGTISIIDRIYSLYNSFDRNNQLINDKFFGFFGDFGAEMRYWRKVCPHGQNYKITGRIQNSTSDIAGNYFLDVIPVWFDDETGERYEPSTTPLKVYVENSVRSNVSYSDPQDVVYEFQGRLFYPSYITKLKISPVISLSNADELTAWYRFSRSTSSRIIEEANDAWSEEPVLFCRSNLGEVDPSIETVGLITVPPLFSGVQNQFASQYGPSYFKISQLVEYVGDHVYNLEFEETDEVTVETGTDEKIFFQTTGQPPGTVGGTSTETVPITFHEIEFDVEVQNNSDDYYKYELEVLYKSTGEESFIQFYKFFSAVCFDVTQEEPPYTGKIRFSASDPIRLYCRPAPEEYLDDEGTLEGFLFNIDQAYREVDNFRYAFTFDPGVWEPQLFLNERRVSTLVVEDVSSFGEFGTEFSQINPFTGQVLFKEKVDTTKSSVSITFNHINEIKTGSQLAVRVVSGPSIGGVTIKNPSVNYYSSPSIERTEGEYSSTLYGDNYHLICPTQGFVSLSGNSWFFQDSAETDDASNFDPGSLRVVGSLTSPFLYFDAFAEPTDIVNKTIKMGNNPQDFPIVDIPHTTIAVNTAGAPFTEIRTIGYTAPDAEAQTKVDSSYDKGMKKFSIIYNINNILNMKYSFTKFIDVDSDGDINFNFMNKRLRISIPIYTGPLYLEEKDISSDDTFSIEESEKTAVGLRVDTFGRSYQELEDETGIFILQSSGGSGYRSFGYLDGEGVNHALFVPVYNEAPGKGATGYIQLPYTQGITNLKLTPKGGTSTGDIQKVFVQYVDDDSLINGVSGDIELFKTGDYAIFYYSTPDSNVGLNQIVAVLSSKDGQYWKRPGVLDLESADSYKPIPILSNYSSPLVLGNDPNDMLYLFVFGNLDNSINIVHVARSIFMKLAKGSDADYEAKEREDGEPINPKNSRTNIATRGKDDEEPSWAEYFGGTGNHILPIVFNSTNIFSAAVSERGTIYFVSKSLDNEIRIKINFSEGGTEYSTGGWFDIGVDLFDPEGYLAKTLENETLYAIVLSYDSSMEGLHLFLSTLDKLFVYRISGALLREKNNSEQKLDVIVNEFLQDLANEIKPVLVIGNTLNLSEDNTILSGVALEEGFIPQQVSVNWTEDGQCWVFFLGDNGTLRCVKSTSDGATWKIDPNV